MIVQRYGLVTMRESTILLVTALAAAIWLAFDFNYGLVTAGVVTAVFMLVVFVVVLLTGKD